MNEAVPGNPNTDSAETYTSWQLEEGIRAFIWAKLSLALMGVVLSLLVILPRVELLVIYAAAVSVDALALIPYWFWAKRSARTAQVGTFASIALGALTITLAVHLAGNFTHPAVFIYFFLIPVACLAIPRPYMAYGAALIATLVYAALIVVETSGLAPLVDGQDYRALQSDVGYGIIVLLGLWILAVTLGHVIVMLEKRRMEHMQAQTDAERRAEAEFIWGAIGKTMISSQDLDQVLNTVVQILKKEMQVEAGTVLLLEPKTEELIFARVIDGNTDRFSTIRLRADQGIVGWVVSHRRPAVVLDPKNDPRWYSGVDHSTGFTTRSILCVPLIDRDQVIGALEVLNKRQGTFTDADLRLLESIAAPVAVAILNARLNQEAKRNLAELTRLFGLVERAKKEWEASVDAIEEGIMMTDNQGRVLRGNRTLTNWLNIEPSAIVGKPCCQVIHGTDEMPETCPHRVLVAGGKSNHEREIEEPRLGGIFRCTAYPLHERDGRMTGSVVVLKNVTQEKKVQAQLMQSEKLAAIGRMAASLAHEINNPLQAIQGCLDMAQATAEDMQKQRHYVAMAKSEVERLASMAQRMLDFNRPAKSTRAQVDVRILVNEVLSLSAKRLQHSRVITQIDWDPAAPLILGAANQLKQVFLNLVLNAADAMPSGGALDIRGHVVQQDGLWLAIDVIDHGAGIPPKDLDKIFEPFYTTKADGTGLGLGISHSIVTSHNGRLSVTSTVGQGTTFTVMLPALVAGSSPADSSNPSQAGD